METYIHHINPVLLPVWGNLALRWYGLAYLAGFITAYLLLDRRGRRGDFPLHGEALQSLIVTVVLGVMIGGRLGYMLFYDFARFSSDPTLLFRLWEGGMASHGGMAGLALATWLAARRRHLPLLTLTDGLASVAPLGLFFGRIANFVNGELWGRVTDVPWAVIFPQQAGIYYGDTDGYASIPYLLETGILHPRHPSQLYQAALEGLLLFALLALARRTPWSRSPGRISGLFLVAYAAARSIGELFREPEITHFGWLTQGQLLSLLILLPAGLYLMLRRTAHQK
jgi:phosphatidylglycerol:prolipoprotein diacylglycerol transferase